jgi:molybdate transport system permease protein
MAEVAGNLRNGHLIIVTENNRQVASDWPFYLAFSLLGGVYVAFIIGMLLADCFFTTPWQIVEILHDPELQASLRLSLLSCTLSTLIALWVAVPLGYLLSRGRFPGREAIDTLLDIPIVLPPLVIGVSLLILFQFPPFSWISRHVVFEVPAVLLAQFAVSTAFAVRTMRVTFDQINPRQEQVAITLGCSRGQAFWLVLFPQARRGLLTAGTLCWARSLGEFGPILVFAGATPFKTEVLSSSVFLQMQAGRLDAALAVSMLMVLAALVVLVIARVFGLRGSGLI